MHDVIAAITIDPSFSLKSVPETGSSFRFCLFAFSSRAFENDFVESVKKTLSFESLGPDILGTTLYKSKFNVSEKIRLPSVHNPWAYE